MFVFYNEFFNCLIGTSINKKPTSQKEVENGILFYNEEEIIGFNFFNVEPGAFSGALLRTKSDLEKFKQLPFAIEHNLEINENKNLKVVKITKCEQHPKSDRLKVCQVTDGESEWQIVTNAENARVDLVTGVAIGDTYTPNGLVITAGKMLNEKSDGMFLSCRTMLDDSYNEDGILELENCILGPIFN